jgi:hypothetical protein
MWWRSGKSTTTTFNFDTQKVAADPVHMIA